MRDRIDYILNNPLEVNSSDLLELQEERTKYPFFYPLILMEAKAISDKKDQRFQTTLQKASIYATNRKILFDYLHFIEVKEEDNKSLNDNSLENNDLITLQKVDYQDKSHYSAQKKIDANIHSKESSISEDDAPSESKENIEKDFFIDYDKKSEKTTGKHSFNDWLKASVKYQTEIEREESEQPEIEEKFKAIEAFLDNNPKITPAKEFKPTIDLSKDRKENLSHLMTETLAKIYVEQNKYDKAIKAYRILGLKYPEKSGYFADRINEVKELKNN